MIHRMFIWTSNNINWNGLCFYLFWSHTVSFTLQWPFDKSKSKKSMKVRVWLQIRSNFPHFAIWTEAVLRSTDQHMFSRRFEENYWQIIPVVHYYICVKKSNSNDQNSDNIEIHLIYTLYTVKSCCKEFKTTFRTVQKWSSFLSLDSPKGGGCFLEAYWVKEMKKKVLKAWK